MHGRPSLFGLAASGQSGHPAQVAKRMLSGDSQIVYNVSGASVFFSDMYEFTTTSNAVTPQELIQFMGYTFGVMDAIAEYRSAPGSPRAPLPPSVRHAPPK